MVQACKFDGDAVRIDLPMDYRKQIGADTLFGNAITPLHFTVPKSNTVAAFIRRHLPAARCNDFLKWKVAHPMGGFLSDGPPHILVASWVACVDLNAVCFDGPAADIMVGLPFWSTRLGTYGKMGASFAIILPQPHGVKIVLFTHAERGNSLLEAGIAQTCVRVTG
eukprot:gnl/MRDRNA2_/MRDRNA2_201720_c0_seq1.p1 gnl/MRDRNA2_/MRDRNA2_201720_c0~~gnl/MRDRNA2_/MRDRNA2_201720_c0_seq1.p1  ORF type:complete len:191 (+),score=28.47 gnl/MRDRNA2_/MRDRNA2_201720_c0_seq1:76-573(+)